MLQNFMTVGMQVLILFILMGIGIIGNRTGLIPSNAISGMTNLVLYFVTPCVIINSFQRESTPELINGLLITAAAAFLIHLISIIIVNLILHDKDEAKEKVFRFSAIFSNCGFMSLPIQESLLGSIGVFYGSVFVAVFNLFVWTYGLVMMSGDKKALSIKKIVFNPGIIGTLLGTLIFAFGIKLPVLISAPVGYMAALNTPLPMIIIGYYLGNLRVEHLKTNLKQYYAIFLRLIVLPLIAVIGLKLFRIDTTISIVCTVASCAPTAAITAMFATRFKRDAQLAAQMVSVSTLFSIITIPLMVALVQL